MAGKAEALAKQFEAKVQEATGVFDRLSDGHALRGDCVGDGVVFGAEKVDDLERGREIDFRGARVSALRESRINERHSV